MPAHGRHPGLAEMALRPIIPDHLADLQLSHGGDEPRPPPDHQQKSGHDRAGGTESDITEDIESSEILVQRIEQMIEHGRERP